MYFQSLHLSFSWWFKSSWWFKFNMRILFLSIEGQFPTGTCFSPEEKRSLPQGDYNSNSLEGEDSLSVMTRTIPIISYNYQVGLSLSFIWDNNLLNDGIAIIPIITISPICYNPFTMRKDTFTRLLGEYYNLSL